MEEENLLQKWVDSDKKLYNTLVDIQSNEKDVKKQAKETFYKISNMYGLPIFPDDNEEELFHSSVYEQLALLNFLEPKGDIREHVLTSLFLIKEKYAVGMHLVYKRQFGSEEPPNNFSGIGYKGNDIDALPVFVMKGQSWFDLGCKYFTKDIDIV